MSEPSKIPVFVFLNTLHDNPSAQWPKFYREAKQIAYRCMQEYPGYPGGLLFLVLPIAQYNSIPQVTVGGVLVPPAIPVYPADLLPAATASEIATYRTQVDFCTQFYRISEAFKAAILVAMGEALVQAISNPLAGDAVTIEVLETFDHLRATYGTLTAGDIRDLQLQLQVNITGDDMATFVTFSAHVAEINERLESAGQGLRSFQQMEAFINATASQPNISKAIDKYVESNPLLVNRTLPLMIAYVRTNLSNVIPTSAASGYSALVSKPDPHLLANQLFERYFSDKLAELDARFLAAASQKPVNREYCYVHGYCNHPGSVCRVMLKNRPNRYSDKMRKAKTHTEVPGGMANA